MTLPPIPYIADPSRIARLADQLRSDYLERVKGHSHSLTAADADWTTIAEQVDRLGADPGFFLSSQSAGTDREDRKRYLPASEMLGPEAVTRYWTEYYWFHASPEAMVSTQAGYLTNLVTHCGMSEGASLLSDRIDLRAWFRVLWAPQDCLEYPQIAKRWRRVAQRQLRGNPLLLRFLAKSYPERLARLTGQG